MRLKWILWVAVLCLAMTRHVAAQDDAPQVFTSELALWQVVESDRLSVDFVIVDEDNIVRVTIDGEDQQFEPQHTVLITKEFVFTPGRTIIRVVVEDEEGNVRERSYLVAFQAPLEPEEPEEAGFRVNIVAELRIEIDDNPTQDLGLPFSVGGLDEVNGQVDDSEQKDTRITLKGLVSLGGPTWAAFAGAVDTSYSKAQHKLVESQVFFLGGQFKFDRGDSFLIGGVLSKILIGGEDYATRISVAPGYEINTKDEEGTSRHLLALELTAKQFDDGTREDDIEYAFKWSLKSLDKERQDSFRTGASLGSRTEGTDESEFFFIRWDGDWRYRWDGGFRWDLGIGYKYRSYPNDKDIATDELFGDTRLDNIFRGSTGLGWEVWKLSIMFNYKYVFNLSNDSPYTRQIYGLAVRGRF